MADDTNTTNTPRNKDEETYMHFFELSLAGSAGTNPRDHDGKDCIEAADAIAAAAVAHLNARAAAKK